MYPQSLDPVAKIDFAFYFIFGISAVLLVGITCCALWFVYKYHHSRHPEPVNITGNVAAEIIWTLLPTLVVMAMFYYGWVGFKALRTVPDNAMEVNVTARMFAWSFAYPNGKRSNVLYVPEKQPVKLLLNAKDVLHSFYMPAFRIKMDTVPGMETYAWFNPVRKGSYDILCAEYCGIKHANMITTAEVISQKEFDTWVNDLGDRRSKGENAFEIYGCTACHSLDGTDGIGPTFTDLFDKKRQLILPDGQKKEVVADERYLRRAIVDPLAEVVEGYDSVMPTYEGTIPEEDLVAMLAWFTGSMKIPDEGRILMEEQGCLSCHSTDGSVIAAPSLQNIWGRKVVVNNDDGEREVESTRQYLIEAIRDPMKEIVVGWDPIMPPYMHLTGKELQKMLEYMKSISPEAP